MKVNNPIIKPQDVIDYIDKNKPYAFGSSTRKPYFMILKEYGHKETFRLTKDLIYSLDLIKLKTLYNKLKQLK